MLDLLYGQVARWRRRGYERRPDRRRRLSRPVISVGNLSVGGTGKTPVVAALTRWLLDHGERPAILSRGYRRAESVAGVVVVSDGRGGVAPLARAGDEPLMLARALPGAIVCVADDRHAAGVAAEADLGATVHVLDDGFQHYRLARDLDLLVTTPGEIAGGHVLPRGRLREPREMASRADVLIVVGADAAGAAAEARTVGVGVGCGARRILGTPAPIADARAPLSPGSRVVAACGIANPRRFLDDLTAAGWDVARGLTFADHHRFTGGDVERIARAASETGAAAVLTTDKDAVRFEAVGRWPFPLFRVPVELRFDPPDTLFARLQMAMDAHRRASPPAFSGARPASPSPSGARP